MRVGLPAIEKSFGCHKRTLEFIPSMSGEKELFSFLEVRIGSPRYFPKSSTVGILICVAMSFWICSRVLREKNSLDLWELKSCLELLQKPLKILNKI